MKCVEFWSWFEKLATRFTAVSDCVEGVDLDAIQTQLHKYCENLWFEVGGDPDGPIEFVISAEGDERYFSKVEELVNAAPDIRGWSIVAFKQPQGFDFVTEYAGFELDPKQCWFLPLRSAREPSRVALRVGVPKFDPEISERIKNGLYVVTDTGLGELVAGQRIAFIEACEVPADPEEDGFLRLNELGDYIAWVSRRADV